MTGTFRIAEHAVVDVGSAEEITRGEGHMFHGLHDGNNALKFGDVDVLDGLVEQIFFG